MEIFLSLKHFTSAQAPGQFYVSFGDHRLSEVGTQKWPGMSESRSLPQREPGEIHPEAGGVMSVRSIILMAAVLPPKGSWSHGAVSEWHRPTAKCGQDQPPNMPNSLSERHFSSEDENIPCQWRSSGPLPFFALPVVPPRLDLGQKSYNKAPISLVTVPEHWQPFCFLAFRAGLQTNAECPKIFSQRFWVQFLAVCTCTVP